MKIRRSVFTTISVIVLLVLPSKAGGMIDVSGVITADTTWTNGDTIHVTGIVTVGSSARLTIEAGTVILFEPVTGLHVDGYLAADGTGDGRIVFTSIAEATAGNPAAGDWGAVYFDVGSDGVMRGCNVFYADNCVYINQASPVFDNCVFQNFSLKGFYIEGYYASPKITPVIENCTIGQRDAELLGTGGGIYIHRSVDAVISRSFVSHCNIGIEFHGAGSITPNFLVENCDVRNNVTKGIYSHADG